MKLDYKIIWVEDKIETKQFKDLIENVKKYLEDQFFNVIIETAEDLDEFKDKFLIHNVFDLIITDLNLNESHGNEVIDFIRDEKHIYTEIFFYSANTNLKNTQLINSNRITFYQLDGQDYHKELNSSIIDLVKLTILKFQNLIAMRGMIMQETSSLDVKIEDILNEIIKNGEKEKIINVIKNKFIDTNKEFASRISSCEDVEDLLQNIGADHRVRALLRNIDNGEIKNTLADYTKEIVVVRNQFAHAVLDEQTNTFRTRNGIVFNDMECSIIRKNINKHLKNLEVLMSSFV